MVSARAGAHHDVPFFAIELPPYLPHILLLLALVVALTMAHRLWNEAHEDIESASERERLSEFEKAAAAGELDEHELRRVRELLGQPVPRAPGTRSEPKAVDVDNDDGTTTPDLPEGPATDRPSA